MRRECASVCFNKLDKLVLKDTLLSTQVISMLFASSQHRELVLVNCDGATLKLHHSAINSPPLVKLHSLCLNRGAIELHRIT